MVNFDDFYRKNNDKHGRFEVKKKHGRFKSFHFYVGEPCAKIYPMYFHEIFLQIYHEN